MLRLLTRMFDPGEGAILADGQDLRRLSKRSLRAAVGVIPQDTVLFNDSLRSNVLYGRPDAGQAALEAAATAARLGPVLRRLPHGWDTMVGERGLKLSGGEKQRVAIARAFLRHAEFGWARGEWVRGLCGEKRWGDVWGREEGVMCGKGGGGVVGKEGGREFRGDGWTGARL